MSEKKDESGSGEGFSQEGNNSKFIVTRDKDLYVDFLDIRACLYDFQMILGKRFTEPGSENFSPDVLVRMSPSHAKDFALMLLSHVVQYEKKFGEIPSQFKINSLDYEKRPQFADKDAEKKGEPMGGSSGSLSC